MSEGNRTRDEINEPHAQRSNDEFEGIGMLYYRRFGRVRPGKDSRLEDSMSDENVRQFSDWIKYQALTDAIFRIIELELELAAYEEDR